MAGRIFLVASAIVVIAAIVAGLMLAGGPQEGRAERLDRARTGDVAAIIRIIATYYAERESVPAELEDLRDYQPSSSVITSEYPNYVYADRTMSSFDELISDPTTGELYIYEKEDSDAFRICVRYTHPPENDLVVTNFSPNRMLTWRETERFIDESGLTCRSFRMFEPLVD